MIVMSWRSRDPHGPSCATGSAPSVLLQRIDDLRARLHEATDLAELFTYFDEHVATVPELFDSSEEREHELLLRLIVTIVAHVRPGLRLATGSLYEVGRTGFWHGILESDAGLACFFYDEREGVGLVAAGDHEGANDFVRLSCVGRSARQVLERTGAGLEPVATGLAN